MPLREFILGLTALDVMTVRQVYYQSEVAALVPKTEAAYRKAQRQVLALRREEKLAWKSSRTAPAGSASRPPGTRLRTSSTTWPAATGATYWHLHLGSSRQGR